MKRKFFALGMICSLLFVGCDGKKMSESTSIPMPTFEENKEDYEDEIEPIQTPMPSKEELTSENVMALSNVLHIKLETIEVETCCSEDGVIYFKYHVNAEDKEKNGCYYIDKVEYKTGTKITIAKEVKKREIKEKNLPTELSYDCSVLCRLIYNGSLEGIHTTKNFDTYEIPVVDTSSLRNYETKRMEVKDCYVYGGMDIEGYFQTYTKYNKVKDRIGAVKSKYNKGFVVKKEKIMVPKNVSTPAFENFGYYANDQYWYNNSHFIEIYDAQQNQICSFHLSEWEKENNIQEEDYYQYIELPNAQMLVSFFREGNSWLVDLKNGEIVKKYNYFFAGKVYGDYVGAWDREDSDLFTLINWKTGEAVLKLNLGEIRESYMGTENYVQFYVYNSDEGEIHAIDSISNSDMPEAEQGMNDINFSMSGDTLYFLYHSGVYRYDGKTNKLTQLFNGKKQKVFKKTYCEEFYVGKDEGIYILGTIGENIDGEYSLICLW